MAVASEEEGPHNPTWQISAKGKVIGTFSLEELERLVAQGRLKRSHLAWKNGMWQPVPCGRIPELAGLFGSPRAIGSEAVAGGIRKLWSFARRIRRRHLLAAAFPVLALLALGIWRFYFYVPPNDTFISVFTAEANGSQAEFAKIEKTGNSYFLSLKEKGQWSLNSPLHPMRKREFTELFGKDWKAANPLGLVNENGQAAILKVLPGWKTGKFVCKTGFFFMKPSGPIQISKIEVRSLALPSLAHGLPEPTPTATAQPTLTPSPSPTIEITIVISATPSPEPTSTEQNLPSAPILPTATSKPTATPKKKESPREVPPKSAPKTLEHTDDPKENPTADKRVGARSQLEQTRQEVAVLRKRIETSDSSRIALQKRRALSTGDSFIDQSRKSEAQGDYETAQEYAAQALNYFQQIERSAGVSSGLATQGGDSANPEATGEDLKIYATALSKSTFSVGEKVEATLFIENVKRRVQFRRENTIYFQNKGTYFKTAPPDSFIITMDPLGGKHAFVVDLPEGTPPGNYRIHTLLRSVKNPSQIVLEHDYDFTVAGPQIKEYNPLPGVHIKVGPGVAKGRRK